jgi:hypothetical protein
MVEYVTLLGAEEVSRAANRMQSAAETMSQAASSIDHTLEMFLRRYDELISREMRVGQVIQDDNGTDYQLPITAAYPSEGGVIIRVGTKHG